jgi:ketosteroid isomerase-like protein
MFSIIAKSCNNTTESEENKDIESKLTLHLEKEKKELQKSIADFRKALATRDAKPASSYCTVDPVFMPNKAPVTRGKILLRKL